MKTPDTDTARSKHRGFLSLLGILKKTYAPLCCAEKFHRPQRESWDAPKQELNGK